MFYFNEKVNESDFKDNLKLLFFFLYWVPIKNYLFLIFIIYLFLPNLFNENKFI